MLPLTAGARQKFINLSAQPPAIFIKERIYVDNGGLESDGGAVEDNVFNVVYVWAELLDGVLWVFGLAESVKK